MKRARCAYAHCGTGDGGNTAGGATVSLDRPSSAANHARVNRHHWRDTGALDARALNASLARCASVSEVLAFMNDVDRFNAVNCATALSRAVRALASSSTDDRGSLGLLIIRTSFVLRGANSGAPRPNGRTLTSIAHALGVLASRVRPEERGSACAALGDVVPAAVALISPGAMPDAGSPGALSTILWAMGTAQWLPENAQTAAQLFDAAAAAAPRMTASELSSAAWGVARCGVRVPALMTSLAGAAASLLSRNRGSFTPQGLANTAWAWAKLRMRPPAALYTGLVAAAMDGLRAPRDGGAGTLACDAQALASLAWSFSRWPSAPLNAALSAALPPLLASRRLPPPTIASLLHALGSGHAEGAGADAWASPAAPGVDHAALDALLAAGVRALIETAPALHAASGGSGGSSALAAAAAAAPFRLGGFSSADIGLIAAAIARGVGALAAPADALSALSAHCEAAAPEMDWRGVAAAELALRRLCGSVRKPRALGMRALCASRTTGVAAAAMRRLAERAAACVVEEAASSDAAAKKPGAMLLKELSSGRLDEALSAVEVRSGARLPLREGGGGGGGGVAVLLVGEDPDGLVCKALSARGVRVVRWRRFTCDAAGPDPPPASAWPPLEPPGGGTYGAAIVRVPPSGDGAAFVFDAVAAVMREPQAPLIAYGLADEGASSIAAALGEQFSGLRVLASSADGAVVAHVCQRAAVLPSLPSRLGCRAGKAPAAEACSILPSKGSLAAWRNVVCDTVSGRLSGSCAPAPPSWVLYPGLFAGGSLDVMSAALLSACPTPPRGARVLDFACGSGALAAALLVREPGLRLTLLDADAVALEAARENVRSVAEAVTARLSAPLPARVTLRVSDGFCALPPERCFDFIISNPPVHRGSADDLRVLYGLLVESRARLLAGGSLWIVAQAQVPVGRLSAAAGWKRMRPAVLADGRFVVWHARSETLEAPAGEVATAQQ